MTFGLGIAAALSAPLIMTIGFIIWEDHWKGSAFSLNMFKCNMATIGFVILSTTTRKDRLFPPDIFTRESIGFLMLSSTIGIIIGDWTWLQGLKLLGARRVILMDSLKPFLAAFFGWAILDENLRLAALGGIVLTVAGVLLVSLESTQEGSNETEADTTSEISPEPRELALTIRSSRTSLETAEDIPGNQQLTQPAAADLAVGNPDSTNKKAHTAKEIRFGYICSILNVGLDTYGAVLIKDYGEGMTVWEINLIRFGFAGVFMLLLSLSLHFWVRMVAIKPRDAEEEEATTSDEEPGTTEARKEDEAPWFSFPFNVMARSDWIRVSAGVVLVTFLTPTLSNYALFQIALALALTLGSVGPLYSLPLSYMLQKNVPTLRACAGAVLAVAGIVVLAFRGTLPEE